MVIDRIVSTQNNDFANFSMTIGNFSGENVVNITADIIYDLTKIPIFVSFSIPNDPNDKSYQRNILKASFNLCRIIEGNTGDFVSKMLAEQLKKISNIPLKCPFPKGTYKFVNFTLKDKYLPAFLFNGDIKYLANVKVLGKVEQRKNLVALFSARSFGRITRN